MILAYNFGVEERLTEWADANQDQQLGRDIRAAVYEVGRLQRKLQHPTEQTHSDDYPDPAEATALGVSLTLGQAHRLQKAFKAQYEANARNSQSLKRAMQALDERRAALAIAIRLMGLHLEMVTPGGVGRDTAAWAVAQDRVRVLEDLLAELEVIKAAVRPPEGAPYDNLQGTQ